MVEEPQESNRLVQVLETYLDLIDDFFHRRYKFEKPTIDYDDSE